MPVELGDRLELFVDTHLIDRMTGVQLKMHKPEPREVILRCDKPWEGRACGYCTVILHEGKYFYYYRGWPKTDGESNYCVAVSDDGIHFERPNLGVIEWEGSKDNNIILAEAGSHNFSPFLDTRPGVPDDQRFKALASDKDAKGLRGLKPYCSADGLHWKPMADHAVLTKGAFDSQNVSFWSEHEGCYVTYYRTWSKGFPEVFKGRRTMSRATSQDYLNWSEPVPMDFGGAPPEEYYTNQTAPYFRAPHIYLAFPKRFVNGRSAMSEAEVAEFDLTPAQANAISDCVFMSSRGGDRYDHHFLEAFLRNGRDRGNWGARTNMSTLNLVPTADDEMSIYFQHRYATPSTYFQRYVLRTDGVASANAPYHGGDLITKVITFTGKDLVLNYATSAAGSVQVELQDPSGEPIEGYTLADCPEIFGDHIERSVQWNDKANVAELIGRPLRMRLVMRDADVYSYRFKK